MTAPTEEAPSPRPQPSSPSSSASPADGAFLDFLELDASRPARQPHRSTWWRIGFPVVLVLLFVSVPTLVYAGIHVVLDSHHGRLIAAATDPAKPGWEVAVEPTPTGVLATLGDDGQLSSVSVLALTSQGTGTVIFVPADTQVPDTPGYKTMVDAYAAKGPDGLKAALEAVVHVDVGEIQTADTTRWDELVTPVGTITVANPDNVDANGQTFPRGSIDLTPAQVASYLRVRNYGEDDTNRLLRQEAFWRSWLAQVAAKGPDSVPGESDSGTGKFVRALAADQVTYAVLPVKVQARPDAYSGVFVPIATEVQQLVAQAVPFPMAAPAGSRPRLRVLDGTGQLDHGVTAAMTLAAAGAQIDDIGNASTFSVPTTQFIISGENERAQADQLRAALGVGEIVTSTDTSDSVDITVILGSDALGLATTQSGLASTAAGGTGSTNTGGSGG
jgi:LytR cell envelope-related transcriptional attenuator/LytR_cpsA_psr family